MTLGQGVSVKCNTVSVSPETQLLDIETDCVSEIPHVARHSEHPHKIRVSLEHIFDTRLAVENVETFHPPC